MTLCGDLLNLPPGINFTRLRAVRRKGINEHGRRQLSRARFTACHLPWTDDGDCACLSPGEWTQTGDTGTRGKEQAPAATTKSAGAKRRCPAECRQLYRRHGESGAAGTAAASAAVDLDVRHQTLAVRPETALRVRRSLPRLFAVSGVWLDDRTAQLAGSRRCPVWVCF